ncbi:hypothetical protein CXB51_024225 [Gossypium anomalum]|uniref:Piwi domain-containing protein n=1 Tax=Gossypium anomalum TaxID=47600 RepID=A0A8J5YJ18_9ROSI|nr:hypothetical protein CXB51_024225 [Gossypium anomalum]
MTETGKNWHKKLPPTLYAYVGANTFNSSCFKGSNHHPWNGCIGFPEQSDVPSKAAMVSSRRWPLISSYGASGRTQSLKLKMEALLDFYTSSGKRKPDQIIIFKDGVSESQFNQILIKLLSFASSLTRSGTLNIVVIVVRKTIIPSFFSKDLLTMCYMAGFSADDLQEFVNYLSYMYQRSTTAIFVVAPICYAHLAASQLGAIYED